jgi:type IV secretory pathway TrbL component
VKKKERMKKIWLIGALIIGLGVGSASAQDDKTVKKNKGSNESEIYGTDGKKSDAERKADKQDKSKAGEVVDDAGGTVKKGGKKVEEGASWTWDKAKHNKATKNTLNQPGDE